MRVSFACSLLALLACGGATHAAIDPSDTASLESGGSPAASEPSAASAASSNSTSGDSSGAATGPLASLSSSPPSGNGSATPAVVHPAPGATGSIDGKPFAPKLAQIDGPLQKDGRVVVTLHEGSDCIAPADAKPGDGAMTLVVTWQNGYVVDLGSLRRAKGGDRGEAAFVRVGKDKKGHISSTFRPTGRLTVVSAPTDTSAFGKLKVDLSSGDYIVAGDLDVKICAALK